MGSPGLRLQGAGRRALGSAKWGVTWVCPGCASGILWFQRSGEGVVVYRQPCDSLVLTRGRSGPGPVAGLEAVPPQMYGTCPGRLWVLGGRSGQAGPSGSGGLGRPSSRAGKPGASALLPIFPVSVLYCFLLLKLTCLIGNWCRIVSRGLLWNISTAVSFN